MLKFEFRNIEGQIFAADFVEGSDNATLQQRPKTVDSLSVNDAIDVLPGAVANRSVLTEFSVRPIFVGRNQADFVRDCFNGLR